MTAARAFTSHFRLFASNGTHGGGRRPEPEFRVDPVELAEWTAANRRAMVHYWSAPNALITARLAR